MRKIQLCLAVLSVVVCLSCNQSGQNGYVKAPDSLLNPINIQKGGDFGSLQTIRAQAKALIEYRINQEGNPLSLVTYGFWQPEYVFNDGGFSEEGQYNGYWIQFNDDFSYQYGYYDDTHGGGQYHMRFEDFQMVLLDDNDEIEPKIWDVMHNGEYMAWVGTHEFGIQNGMQIKMKPMDRKPVRG